MAQNLRGFCTVDETQPFGQANAVAAQMLAHLTRLAGSSFSYRNLYLRPLPERRQSVAIRASRLPGASGGIDEMWYC